MTADNAVDLVYTWVDDRWPGYLDALRRFASSEHDLNPNRTRDNLDLLRYSLRSVALHAPWIRNVYLFTCRPQVPGWLDRTHPRLRIVHHDEVIEPAHLPTFNSFAIISHLHRLPGLSRHFLYMEDDMLLGRPVVREDLADRHGRMRVFPRLTRAAAPARRDEEGLSPWNAALSRSNWLLDSRYGSATRPQVNHVPLYIDASLWGRMLQEWLPEVERTRASRFRARGNIAPEFMYPHFAMAAGRARAGSLLRTYRQTFYFPLENSLLQVRAQAAALRCLRPRFIAMNDNFGAAPAPRVVCFMRALLERLYPRPSAFEAGDPAEVPAARTAPEIRRAAH